MPRFARRTHVPSAILAGVLLLAPPAAGNAAGQIPGGDPGDSRRRYEAARARVRADALEDVRATLQQWSDAWAVDGAGQLSELYAEAGSIRGLPFGSGSGREGIEAAFRDFLDEAGPVTLNLREFDAGGLLAFSVADYSYTTPDAEAAVRRGTVLTVFMKRGGDWRIRSQLFRPAEVG